MQPLRFSHLKWMSRSPAHYRYYQDEEFASTPAMLVGSATDALVFETQSVLHYDRVRRGKEWEEAKAKHPDAIWLSASEMKRALGMAASLKQNPTALRLLGEGTRQQRIEWEYSGRQCAGTPDAFSAENLVDLKTTVNAFPPKFERDALWRGYHAQLAWYRHGLVQSGRPKPRHVYIVSVESTPPYLVVVRPLTDRALEMGERLWRSWFEQLRVCEDSNEWPGYADCEVELDVPDDDFTITIGGEDVSV